jgi:hypothetical protein
MSTVFISYRRETAAGEARALYGALAAQLGRTSAFMDVDSIALGRDFRSVLQKTLESCDVMLVVIDKDWVEDKNEKGEHRLEDPHDYVRMEVSAGLKRDIVVTPVLVRGAHMPAAEQLPEEIRDLAYRNAFEITHNRWESDVQEMIRRLGLKSEGIETNNPSIAPILATAQFRSWMGKHRHILIFAVLLVGALSVGVWLNTSKACSLVGIGPANPNPEEKPAVVTGPYDYLKQSFDGDWKWVNEKSCKQLETKDLIVIEDIQKGEKVTGRGADPKYGDYTIDGVIRDGEINAKYFSSETSNQFSQEGTLVLRIMQTAPNVILHGEWYGIDVKTKTPLLVGKLH